MPNLVLWRHVSCFASPAIKSGLAFHKVETYCAEHDTNVF